MRLSILTLALAGISVLGFAGQDITFETDDLDGLPSPTFSGSTASITNPVFDSQYTGDFNDTLNPIDGTPGVQCYIASWEWDFDIPGSTPGVSSFVRITDAAGGRHLMSEPAPSGGIGIYLKYDGSAGDVEWTLTIREDPIQSLDNEVYETFTPWRTLSGSPDWQYNYFAFSEIVSDEDNWGQYVLPDFGDGVYDGGGAGDATSHGNVLIRPITGVTQTATNFTILIDDIHTGAEHSPLGVGPVCPVVGFDSAIPEVVVELADIQGASGQGSTELRELGVDSTGQLLLFDSAGDGDSLGALWRVDVSGANPVFNQIATEAAIIAAGGATPGLECNGVQELTDGTIIFSSFNGGSDTIESINPVGPVVTNLLTRDGLNGADAIAISGEATIIYASEGAFGGADEFGSIPITGGADTTFINEADFTAASGATDFSVTALLWDSSNGNFTYVENNAFGGTGGIMTTAAGSPTVPTVLAVAGDFPGGVAGVTTAAIDSCGNIYMYDEFGGSAEGERFVVRESDGTFHVPITRDEILSATGFSNFEAKGLAVYEVSPDEVYLYATDDENDVVVRLSFLSTTAAESWAMYR